MCDIHRDHSPTILVEEAHHVIPLSWGPPAHGQTVEVGPTCHLNCHFALDAMVHHGGPGLVPWSVRRHIGRSEWATAVNGWNQAIALGLVPKPTL